MTSYLVRRGVAALLLLFLVLTATFVLLHLAPGDPLQTLTSPRLPAAERARIARAYGLDRPLPAQYLAWIAAAARGDWGISFVHQRPVLAVLADALPATLLLGALALPLEFLVGILLGVAAARRAGRAADHLLRAGTLLLYSLPLFWLAVMAILCFAVRWPLFPPGHLRDVGAAALPPLERLADLLHHAALPALVLAVSTAGGVARLARASFLEVLQQDYIRVARAKGLSERRVVWVHGLRNAAGPLLQLLGLHLPYFLGGSLIVEVVFSWPGAGRLAYEAILARDYPLVLGATALNGLLVVLGTLLADLLQAAADPRVRHG